MAGRGSTQRSHLVSAPREVLTPARFRSDRLLRGERARSRSSRGWLDHAAGAAASRLAAEDQPPPAARRRMRPAPAASAGNLPNGAAPDCFLANMHPPPATAPRSGKRRARRRPASGQGPDLAQLQHLPLLLSERGRGTSDAGGAKGRAPRGRGGSRRECAAPGPAAPPIAASAAPPARLRRLRGLGGPPGSSRLRAPPPPPLPPPELE